jgi:hypothetical protein
MRRSDASHPGNTHNVGESHDAGQNSNSAGRAPFLKHAHLFAGSIAASHGRVDLRLLVAVRLGHCSHHTAWIHAEIHIGRRRVEIHRRCGRRPRSRPKTFSHHCSVRSLHTQPNCASITFSFSEFTGNSGLATYNTFDMHWKPCAAQASWTEVHLDNYKCLDAKVRPPFRQVFASISISMRFNRICI